ncbi:MAG: hypothetical protein ACPGR8_00805 [Limisphaerales bacterium]
MPPFPRPPKGYPRLAKRSRVEAFFVKMLGLELALGQAKDSNFGRLS